MTALAVISLAFVAYTYVGYGLLLLLWQARRRTAAPVCKGAPPRISVIVAACNEAGHIQAKLDDIASLDYPPGRREILIGSDGSTDDTEAIARAHPVGARVFHFEHVGKTAVLNRLAAEADGEILVFMDARQTVTRDALMRFAAWFEDSCVAAVGAELALVDDNGRETAAGVGVYWKWEKWLRRRESDLGLLTGLSGALYALRREAFEAPPDDTILDDVAIPLAPARRGFRLVIDDGIRMYDRVADEDREFRRKVRTLVGNFQLFARLLARPRPFPPRLIFSLLSHKVCRAVTPVALVCLIVAALLMPAGSLRTALLAGQALVYGLGGLSLAFGGRSRNRLLSVCSTFCVLNAAAAVAMVRYLTGRYRTAWR